ncbi:MAG TPA: MmgE/PrpD family protein [Burkholderiales bacterium]|nr:MmgE/PrpD family protein [Burkholderiales bacterium]
MTITASLADWLCTQRWPDLPAEVRRRTVDVVFDSVGAMTACSQLPEVVAIVKFLRRMGGNADRTVNGHTGSTSVANAAMADGGMSRGNESDPAQRQSVGGHLAGGQVLRAQYSGLKSILVGMSLAK